jgi:co-chaperonin GroES (HSP10)
MIELKPPLGKVIIRKDEPKSKTAGGIHLRANDRPRSHSGTIVASSAKDYMDGDKIIFNPQISSTINFQDENLVIIFETDILAKIGL